MISEKKTPCKHENFSAQVNVGRLALDEGLQRIAGFTADIAVKCTQCDTPFEWLGLPLGSSPLYPTCSVDGLEARMPLKPKGEVMPHANQLVGFTIRRVMGGSDDE